MIGAGILIILFMYIITLIICISFFVFPVLSYNRPEGTGQNRKKEGADNAEGILRKLLPSRGQISSSAGWTLITTQKEGVKNAEGVL